MTLKVVQFLRPKMNIFVVLIVFLALAGIDQFFVPKVVDAHIPQSADYRSPHTYTEMKALIERVNQDSSPKIITVGDSVTYGGGVSTGDETTAHFLQQDLIKDGVHYHVYNLGMEGAAPGDTYAVVQSLRITKRDIVVYDLNVGYFGSFAVKIPDVTDKLANVESLSKVWKTSKNPIEQELRVTVNNHWKLFALRNLVKDQVKREIHGQPLMDKPQPKPDPKAWYTTDWTDKTQGMFQRGSNTFNDNDGSLNCIKEMVQYVNHRGGKFFVYNTPLNQQMMAQYNMMDRPHYDANIARLKSAIVGAGALYVDYETVVPSPYFMDSIHPTKEGNQILAQHLDKDLTPYLVSGGSS